MLSTPAPRPSSSDFGFFSPSKGSNSVASTSNNVVVKTRIARKPLHPSHSAFHSRLPLTSSPDSSPLSSPNSGKKRKSASTSPNREPKRSRPSAPSINNPKKRASKSSQKHSSRVPSRQQTLQPSPEPIYRTSRSRSTSAFHAYDDDVPIISRNWVTDDEGILDTSSHLSSEKVVRDLHKSYKACKSLSPPFVLTLTLC